MNNNNNALKRSLNLPLITFYGLGNILGAGIYVLVGKVAGEAGYFAPLSFFIASIIAAISAMTYAELSARYPVSAGEAVYLYEGFQLRWLSMVVGLLIVSATVVSSAAIAHGFAGYLKVTVVDFIPAFQAVPSAAIIIVMLSIIGALAVWGISQSVKVAALFTLLEIAGLCLIIWVGTEQVPMMEQNLKAIPELTSSFSFVGIFAGAFLAFYAYLGFEDMVNVAEEVKDPQRTMPRAIFLAVIISTLLYAGVATVSVLLVEPQQLAQSEAPLADVYVAATGNSPIIISLIGMFAVVNGALIQLIMASRLLYGMGSRGWIPRWFSKIHPPTRTPVNSTLLVVALMMFFSIMLPMVTLAEMTSFLILIVFALINLALIKIKQKQPAPEGVRVFSVWIPKLGFATTVLFLLLNVIRNLF